MQSLSFKNSALGHFFQELNISLNSLRKQYFPNTNRQTLSPNDIQGLAFLNELEKSIVLFQEIISYYDNYRIPTIPEWIPLGIRLYRLKNSLAKLAKAFKKDFAFTPKSFYELLTLEPVTFQHPVILRIFLQTSSYFLFKAPESLEELIPFLNPEAFPRSKHRYALHWGENFEPDGISLFIDSNDNLSYLRNKNPFYFNKKARGTINKEQLDFPISESWSSKIVDTHRQRLLQILEERQHTDSISSYCYVLKPKFTLDFGRLYTIYVQKVASILAKGLPVFDTNGILKAESISSEVLNSWRKAEEQNLYRIALQIVPHEPCTHLVTLPDYLREKERTLENIRFLRAQQNALIARKKQYETQSFTELLMSHSELKVLENHPYRHQKIPDLYLFKSKRGQVRMISLYSSFLQFHKNINNFDQKIASHTRYLASLERTIQIKKREEIDFPQREKPAIEEVEIQLQSVQIIDIYSQFRIMSVSQIKQYVKENNEVTLNSIMLQQEKLEKMREKLQLNDISDQQKLAPLLETIKDLEIQKKAQEQNIASMIQEIDPGFDTLQLRDIAHLARNNHKILQQFKTAKKKIPCAHSYDPYFRFLLENCIKTLNLLELYYPKKIIPFRYISKLFNQAFRIKNDKFEQQLRRVNEQIAYRGMESELLKGPWPNNDLENLIYHFYNKHVNPGADHAALLLRFEMYCKNPELELFEENYYHLKQAIINTRNFICEKFKESQFNNEFARITMLEHNYASSFEALFAIHVDHILAVQAYSKAETEILKYEKIASEFKKMLQNSKENQNVMAILDHLFVIYEKAEQLQVNSLLFLYEKGEFLANERLPAQYFSLESSYQEIYSSLMQLDYQEYPITNAISEINNNLATTFKNLSEGIKNKCDDLHLLQKQIVDMAISSVRIEKELEENITKPAFIPTSIGYLKLISSVTEINKTFETYLSTLSNLSKSECFSPNTESTETPLQYCYEMVYESNYALQDCSLQLTTISEKLLQGVIEELRKIQEEAQVFANEKNNESSALVSSNSKILNSAFTHFNDIVLNITYFKKTAMGSFLHLNKEKQAVWKEKFDAMLQTLEEEKNKTQDILTKNLEATLALRERNRNRRKLCNKLMDELESNFAHKLVFFFTPNKNAKEKKKLWAKRIVTELQKYLCSGESKPLFNEIKIAHCSFSDTQSKSIVNRMIAALLDLQRAVPKDYFKAVESAEELAAQAQTIMDNVSADRIAYKNQLLAINTQIQNIQAMAEKMKREPCSSKMKTLFTHLKTDLDTFIIAHSNNSPTKEQLQDFQFLMIARLRSQDDLLSKQPRAVLASIANFLIAVFTLGVAPLICNRYAIFKSKEQEKVDEIETSIQNVLGG